jgi:beta-lactamase class D|nr:penicillin-binding transpeptidase domain-containing protein [uncultured Thiodictyon sp.]
MLVETTPTYSIRAKTGWTGRAQPSIGWYVGYVERGDAVWFFATNLDLPDQQDLPLRQGLTHEALRVKGIIDGESRE